jgi:hypothetical protein
MKLISQCTIKRENDKGGETSLGEVEGLGMLDLPHIP